MPGRFRVLALAVDSGRILSIDPHDGLVTILSDQAGPFPDGLLVEGDSIYWTTMGRRAPAREDATPRYPDRDGGLHAVGLDGRGRRDVLPRGSLTTGKQLASDGAGRLYWADREGCRVSAASIDGTGLTDLVIRHVGDDGDPALGQCVGVAVDASGWIYWSQKGPTSGGLGRILRAPLALAPGQSPVGRSDIEVLWEGLPAPIEVQLFDGWIYWTDRGCGPGGSTLNGAPLPHPGERPGPPTVLATGFEEAIGLVVDEARDRVLVSDLGGTIRSVPIPRGHRSGQSEQVIATLGEAITGIAIVASR